MRCPGSLTLSLQRSSEPLVKHSDSGYYNRSFSLNKQQMRRTVREGYCMLINQSTTMIWIRRIIQLLLALVIAVVFYFTGFALFHTMGDSRAGYRAVRLRCAVQASAAGSNTSSWEPAALCVS